MTINDASTVKISPLDRVLARITPEMQHRVNNRMMIAARIADALEEKGISQIKFAKMLDKSHSMITQWLSGTQNFTMDTLSDIESALGIQLLQTVEPQPVVVEFRLVIEQAVPAKPQPSHQSDNEATISSSKAFSASQAVKQQFKPRAYA